MKVAPSLPPSLSLPQSYIKLRKVAGQIDTFFYAFSRVNLSILKSSRVDLRDLEIFMRKSHRSLNEGLKIFEKEAERNYFLPLDFRISL